MVVSWAPSFSSSHRVRRVVVVTFRDATVEFDVLIDQNSFYINLPIGAFAAAFIIFTFTSPKTAQRKFSDQQNCFKERFLQMDLPGLVLIIGALQCLLLALYWGGVTKTMELKRGRWDSGWIRRALSGFHCFRVSARSICYACA